MKLIVYIFLILFVCCIAAETDTEFSCEEQGNPQEGWNCTSKDCFLYVVQNCSGFENEQAWKNLDLRLTPSYSLRDVLPCEEDECSENGYYPTEDRTIGYDDDGNPIIITAETLRANILYILHHAELVNKYWMEENAEVPPLMARYGLIPMDEYGEDDSDSLHLQGLAIHLFMGFHGPNDGGSGPGPNDGDMPGTGPDGDRPDDRPEDDTSEDRDIVEIDTLYAWLSKYWDGGLGVNADNSYVHIEIADGETGMLYPDEVTVEDSRRWEDDDGAGEPGPVGEEEEGEEEEDEENGVLSSLSTRVSSHIEVIGFIGFVIIVFIIVHLMMKRCNLNETKKSIMERRLKRKSEKKKRKQQKEMFAQSIYFSENSNLSDREGCYDFSGPKLYTDNSMTNMTSVGNVPKTSEPPLLYSNNNTNSPSAPNFC